MEKENMILGRVSLNAFKIENKSKPCPVIEILSDDCDEMGDGDIVVLEVKLAEK